MSLTISAASNEYVRVPVWATEAGAFVNPTADTVEMGFVASGVPTSWKAATWETDATVDPVIYSARCLVGPSGTVTLTAGTYQVWVKVHDSPETPVLHAGRVTVV